jgi:hypothetical protein
LALPVSDNPKAERAGNLEFPPNCLPVEDLIAIGYPRPAPFITARDPVSFMERTAGLANRSMPNLFFKVPA